MFSVSIFLDHNWATYPYNFYIQLCSYCLYFLIIYSFFPGVSLRKRGLHGSFVTPLSIFGCRDMEVAEFSTIGPAFNMRLDESPPILFVSRRTCVNDDARPGFFATGQEKSRPLFMQYSILGEKVSIALGWKLLLSFVVHLYSKVICLL